MLLLWLLLFLLLPAHTAQGRVLRHTACLAGGSTVVQIRVIIVRGVQGGGQPRRHLTHHQGALDVQQHVVHLPEDAKGACVGQQISDLRAGSEEAGCCNA